YSEMLLYSSDSDLYVKMGNCFEKMGKPQTALEYWDKATEVDPMNSNAYINFGNYYYKKNQIEKAISYWLASLIPMPEEPTSNLNLAVAYTIKEMHPEAFTYYDRYLKFAQDKTSEKYLSIQKKIERNKKLGNDYLKLGVQYQNNGEKLSALKCYKRAVAYCPIYSKIHLNLGSLYYADKNYDEAVQHWTNALYLDPNYPKIINNLAIAYDMMQKYDYAYCYYTRYGKFAANKPLEIEKITARCHKIKPVLNANPYLITNHLEAAEEAFSQCDYKKALNEYKNYIILEPNAGQDYIDLIIKIENYLNPEKNIIENCMLKGRKLIANDNNFEEAKQYFARILVLADSSSPEYQEAKGRLALCLQY
ncbi:tetratricopeptide repeat protein, partial [bacterium]|nr:tetratricopeptide repeat protein [bacterium]